MSKSPYIEYADEWNSLYESGLTINAIAAKYAVNSKTVRAMFVVCGTPVRDRSIKCDKNLWIQEYKQGMNTMEIGEKYGVHSASVGVYLKEHSVQIRPRNERQRTYPLNEHYFDVLDSDDKCYWLGALAADGYIRISADDSRHKAVVLTQHEKDIAWMKMFLRCVGTDENRKCYYSNANVLNTVLPSSHMVETLIRHGIVQRKSLVLQFPEIVPDEFRRAFIRGYFDGDGHATTSRNGRLEHYPRAGFTSGSEALIRRINEIIEEEVGIAKRRVTFAVGHRVHGVYRIEYQGKNVTKLYDYFYTGATFWMERKRAIMQIAKEIEWRR